MRIIEFCTSESLGGLELYFVNCCKTLQKRGHDITAIVKYESKIHNLIKEEVSCIEIPKGLLKSTIYLLDIIKKIEPEVIHSHHKKDLFLLATLKHLSKHSYKYAHTRQMDQPRNKKNPYHTFIYRSMDSIIAITDRLKNQIIKNININPEKVVRLYYGVPLFANNSLRCNEIKLNRSCFNIAVVARIDRKKEQHIIIEAINQLINTHRIKIKTFLIGGANDEKYLSEINLKIKEFKLEDHISITGFLETPQEIMPCFDTIILTTRNETFGLVLPEAMRMGVAVIGANGGGVPEIIDHNETGLLFESGNSFDLAKKIKQMMNNDLRKELALKGKEKADKLFEINNHFNHLEKILA